MNVTETKTFLPTPDMPADEYTALFRLTDAEFESIRVVTNDQTTQGE